jgi:hypothetical protein
LDSTMDLLKKIMSTHQIDQDNVRKAMMELQEVFVVVQGVVHVKQVHGEHGRFHGVAQEGHVTHQIDHYNVRNVLMEIQEVVGVVHYEVHVLHVQGEHEQLHGAAYEDHVTHQIDQCEILNHF